MPCKRNKVLVNITAATFMVNEFVSLLALYWRSKPSQLACWNKVKVFHVHTIKHIVQSRGIEPHILQLGTRWKQLTSCLSHFTHRRETQYLLNTWLSTPQSQCGHFWRREKSPAPTVVWAPDFQIYLIRVTHYFSFINAQVS